MGFRCKKKINIIKNTRSFLTGEIKNLASYLLNALEKDFQPPKSSREILSKNKKTEENVNNTKKSDKEKHFEYRENIRFVIFMNNLRC